LARRIGRTECGLLTAIIGSLSLYGVIFPQSSNPMIATYTDPICMEFLAGAWAANICSDRDAPPWTATTLLVAGVTGLWLGYRYEADLGVASWLVTASAASLIIVGAVLLERRARFPRLSWLKFGGERSQLRHGTTFTLKHIAEDKIFGTKVIWRGHSKIAVSDIHRTIVDMLDDPAIGGGIQHVEDCVRAYFARPDRDEAVLIAYADRLGNGAVFKRLGFLAEREGKVRQRKPSAIVLEKPFHEQDLVAAIADALSKTAA
jgi:hypothetical protein